MLKVNAAANGTVYGGSIYGDVYPPGTTVSITGIPYAGYALSNWTYTTGGSGTVSGNPLTVTLNQNTTLTPTFTSSSNYSITYLGNNNTSGSSPAIASYSSGATGTISGNTGNLSKNGYMFSGWNTQNNGSGTSYAAGATYSSNANLILYANWVSNGITLPVSLISFSAIPGDDQQTVQIRWRCASEKNNKYFEVQRSLNCSGNWETILRVPGAGNHNSPTDYQAVDPQPASGLSCYRLLQADIDGQNTLSSGVSVILQPLAQKRFLLYPNPATSQFVIWYKGNLKNRLTILNSLGQSVTSQCKLTYGSAGQCIVDVSLLYTGLYFVRVDNMVRTLSISRRSP